MASYMSMHISSFLFVRVRWVCSKFDRGHVCCLFKVILNLLSHARAMAIRGKKNLETF